MKILVKSDDYGFTKGVTDGIVDAMRNGIITCTGLFANMPAAPYAVSKMAEFPNVCFGIDINLVSGPSILGKDEIPTLIDENGEFIRSTVKYKDPRYVKGAENEELWPYEECFKEACAQVEKYIELVGKKPEYITTHSIGQAAGAYVRALSDVGKKYGLPFAREVFSEKGFFALPSLNVKPFTMEAQLNADVEGYTLQMLEEHKDKEFVNIGGHGGFVDDELLKYSTFTLIRPKDHAMYTSPRIKQWIKDNDAELISFRDLLKD